jgi:ATP-dependent DNA ligase
MGDWIKMPFEERQKEWKGQVRTFRQLHGRNERPTVWTIGVQQDRVYTSHGLLGGAMQETDYQGKAKNVGRSNAITAEQDALAEARRDCRKKWDFEGYDEFFGEINIDNRTVESIQGLLTALPGSFCLYKPENNIEDCKKLLKKAESGKVLYSIKRDGLAFWIVVDYYGNITIYSRRSRPYNDKEGPTELEDGTVDYRTMKPWALRFPHLVEAVRSMNLPPGTMLAGELLWFKAGSTRENFAQASSFTKSLTEQSLSDQATFGRPVFYWWDLPFLSGYDLVSNERVVDRYSRILGYTTPHAGDPNFPIIPVGYLQFPSVERATEYAKANNLEGFVVVDPDGIYGDKAWNLKGKPDRPGAYCAKLKPRQEDDFICGWHPDEGVGEYGTGKHELGKTVTLPSGEQVKHGGVGAVMLYQYNNQGQLVPISKCSSGMDYEFQSKLTPLSFPFVAQIEYLERTYQSEGDKTNALRHPVFVRLRTDKKPEECINDRL